MDISVYRILNVKNGKFYIGYSQETKKRFLSHINMLNRKEHHCIHLQRAWDIDGLDSFVFEKIVECDSVDEAIAEEQKHLDVHFKSGLMYNSVGTNDKSVAMMKAHSREARAKNTESKKNSEKFMSALAKNRMKALTKEAQEKRVETARRNGTLGKACMVSIVARNLSGGGERIYGSIREASVELKISKGNICSCCRGDRPRAGNYTFSYELPHLNWRSDSPKQVLSMQRQQKKEQA
jgi:group I intron endonuclease